MRTDHGVGLAGLELIRSNALGWRNGCCKMLQVWSVHLFSARFLGESLNSCNLLQDFQSWNYSAGAAISVAACSNHLKFHRRVKACGEKKIKRNGVGNAPWGEQQVSGVLEHIWIASFIPRHFWIYFQSRVFTIRRFHWQHAQKSRRLAQFFKEDLRSTKFMEFSICPD